MFKNQLSNLHDRLEIEIDICADNAKDLKRDLDIIHIYEHLMRAAGWNIGDKFLINEEWRTLVVDTENTFSKNVCHLERSRAFKGEQRVYFVAADYRHVPTNKIWYKEKIKP